MPKIIVNLESRLIEEARKQIEQEGYGAVTIRSVANACGVGVGTVYNYFSSKDALLATYMLRDWETCLTAIRAVSNYSESALPVLRCIFDHLTAYTRRHSAVFCDEAAAASFAGSAGRYHSMLRGQLAEPIRKHCSSDFTAEFIAESLLTWTVAGKTFDQIYALLEKLL